MSEVRADAVEPGTGRGSGAATNGAATIGAGVSGEVTGAIEIVGLTHRYGPVTALDDVTFSVPSGAICGLVGPNGAGKTTLLSVAATLLVPTGGSVAVLGADSAHERARVRRSIGYMPDFFGVYEDMKVWEYLDYFGAAYGIPLEERRARIPGLLELVHLSAKHDDYVEALSRGMQQRLCLARTLIHDPAVLLLDEPAAGLDPRARVELRELLRGLHVQGTTVLISSHVLADLADICTHVVVLERGRLVSAGRLEDLMSSAKGVSRVLVRVLDDVERAQTILGTNAAVLAVETSETDPARLEVSFSGDDHKAAALLEELLAQGVRVVEFCPERDLESAFLAVTEGEVS